MGLCGSLLVVNLRGMVNVPEPVKRTLRLLNIAGRFRATVVPETPSYMGMLRKAQSRVAWCRATPELLEKVFSRRLRLEGWRPVSEEELRKLGFSSFRELAEKVAEGSVKLSDLRGVKPFLALHPPRGGFKRSSKKLYGQRGVLGENPELPSLVERML